MARAIPREPPLLVDVREPSELALPPSTARWTMPLASCRSIGRFPADGRARGRLSSPLRSQHAAAWLARAGFAHVTTSRVASSADRSTRAMPRYSTTYNLHAHAFPPLAFPRLAVRCSRTRAEDLVQIYREAQQDPALAAAPLANGRPRRSACRRRAPAAPGVSAGGQRQRERGPAQPTRARFLSNFAAATSRSRAQPLFRRRTWCARPGAPAGRAGGLHARGRAAGPDHPRDRRLLRRAARRRSTSSSPRRRRRRCPSSSRRRSATSRSASRRSPTPTRRRRATTRSSRRRSSRATTSTTAARRCARSSAGCRAT